MYIILLLCQQQAKIEKIIEAAKKLDCRGSSFKTGSEIKERRRRVVRLATGASQLDKILGGGIETGVCICLFGCICVVYPNNTISYQSITELFGEFRTGKTQLSHTLCVTCQVVNVIFTTTTTMLVARISVFVSQMSKEVGGGEGKAIYLVHQPIAICIHISSRMGA